MNPLQNVWPLNLNFPFSGSVAQQIEPNTNWFFNGIDVNAGDARIEKKAFDIASYGRQIGWLTELVLEIADKLDVAKVDVAVSKAEKSPYTRLRDLSEKIEGVKKEEAATMVEEILSRLQWLKKNDQLRYSSVSKSIEVLLKEKP